VRHHKEREARVKEEREKKEQKREGGGGWAKERDEKLWFIFPFICLCGAGWVFVV
jgi:hypothetical protein